jgi:glucose/arabinose dehydrogenase
MFVADVGQDSWEEIDIMQKGGNFGWNVMEGTHCYPPGTTTCDVTGKILPIFEYPHTDSIAVIGGFIYTGTAIPSLANKYIFADLTGKLWSLDGSARRYRRAPTSSPPASPSHPSAATPPENCTCSTTTATS